MNKLFQQSLDCLAEKLELSDIVEQRSWVKMTRKSDCQLLTIDSPTLLMTLRHSLGKPLHVEQLFRVVTHNSARAITTMDLNVRYAEADGRQEIAGGFYVTCSIGDVLFTHEVTRYVARFKDRRLLLTRAAVKSIYWEKVYEGSMVLLRTALLESLEKSNAAS